MIQFEALRTTPEQPDLLLHVNNELFDEPVEAINRHLSDVGAQRYIDMANNAQLSGPMRYAVVGGGTNASQTEAAFMAAPFANGAWPHLLGRADAISFALEAAGVSDSKGNPLPVIVSASPSMKSGFGLDDEELFRVSRGDYAPVAARHKKLASDLGFKGIRGFVGMSQAAVYATPFAEAIDYDMRSPDFAAIVAEPPHATERNAFPLVRQGVGMMLEGLVFKKALKDESIDAINEIFASGEASPGFYSGIVKGDKDNDVAVGKENLAHARGFNVGLLANDLAMLGQLEVPNTTLHATDSRVSDRDDVIDAVEWARSFWRDNRNGRVEIEGANHTIGDRVGRFAILSAAALLPVRATA